MAPCSRGNRGRPPPNAWPGSRNGAPRNSFRLPRPFGSIGTSARATFGPTRDRTGGGGGVGGGGGRVYGEGAPRRRRSPRLRQEGSAAVVSGAAAGRHGLAPRDVSGRAVRVRTEWHLARRRGGGGGTDGLGRDRAGERTRPGGGAVARARGRWDVGPVCAPRQAGHGRSGGGVVVVTVEADGRGAGAAEPVGPTFLSDLRTAFRSRLGAYSA